MSAVVTPKQSKNLEKIRLEASKDLFEAIEEGMKERKISVKELAGKLRMDKNALQSIIDKKSAFVSYGLVASIFAILEAELNIWVEFKKPV